MIKKSIYYAFLLIGCIILNGVMFIGFFSTSMNDLEQIKNEPLNLPPSAQSIPLATWWNGSWYLRTNINITTMAGVNYTDYLIEYPMNFTNLLKANSVSGVFDDNSCRVIEWEDSIETNREIPSQFDKAIGFDATNNAIGTLCWVMDGNTISQPGLTTTRTYFIYFDTVINGPKTPANYSDVSNLTITLNAAEDYTLENDKILIKVRDGATRDCAYNVTDKRTNKLLNANNILYAWNIYQWNYGGDNYGTSFYDDFTVTVLTQGPIRTIINMTLEKTNYVYQRFYTMNYLDDTIRMEHFVRAKNNIASAGTWTTQSQWSPGLGGAIADYNLVDSAYGYGGQNFLSDSNTTWDGSNEFTSMELPQAYLGWPHGWTNTQMRTEAWTTIWDEKKFEGVGTIWDPEPINDSSHTYVSCVGYIDNSMATNEGRAGWLYINPKSLSAGQNFTFTMWGQIYNHANGTITKARAKGLQYKPTIVMNNILQKGIPTWNPPPTPSLNNIPSPDTDGTFQLTWSAVENADNYTLYRSNKTITELNITVVKLVEDNILFFDQTNLPQGVYYYALRSNNETGYSEFSNSLRIEVDYPDPDTPTLSASTSTSINGSVYFTWNAVTGADNYTIYRHSSYITVINETLTKLNTSEYLEYREFGLTDNTYYYAVVGTNESGDSDPSNCIAIQVSLDITLPSITTPPTDRTVAEGTIGDKVVWVADDTNKRNWSVYRNETFISTGPWSAATELSTSLNGLLKGIYNFTIYLQDWNNNIRQHSVIITIVDNTKPSFDVEPTLTSMTEDTVNNKLTWIIRDLHPATYSIYRNGTIQGTTQLWSEAPFSVVVSLDGLLKGDYNFTIFINDTSSNWAESTVIVQVRDKIPPQITTPADITYYLGQTNIFIKWTATDRSPKSYRIYRNGTSVDTGAWISNETIEWNIDSLAAGIYNYTIVFIDEDGNSNSDTVMVTVIDPNASDPSDQPFFFEAWFWSAIGASATVIFGIYELIKRKSKAEPK